MKSVKGFNGLNGSQVTRDKIIELIGLAESEEQTLVANRLRSALLVNSDEIFDINIEKPAIEQVPHSFLRCLDNEPCSDDAKGLGKAVSPTEIYDMITKKVIDALTQKLDFTQEWGSFENSEGGYLIAYNFDSKKQYRGINSLMLNSLKLYSPGEPLLRNPYYMTFKQVVARKGKVRKGAKGLEVIYFTNLYSLILADKKIDFSTYDKEKMKAFCSKHSISWMLVSEIPILKYYNVFNGADIDGIDFDLENFKGKGFVAPQKAVKNKVELIPQAEAIIKAYPKPAPQIRFGGNDALYNRGGDFVQMPKPSQFSYIQAYYTTMFHELIHSTGSPSRLDRVKGKVFGDKDYSFEELIAELGASFISAEAGMLHYTFRNSAAYIKGWRANLLALVENDNKFFFRAASQAQKAVDFMLDRDADGVAAYEKLLPKPEEKEIKKPARVKSKVTVSAKVEKNIKNTPNVKTPAQRRKDKKKPDGTQLALFGTIKNGLKKRAVISDPVQPEITVVEDIAQLVPTVPARADIIPGPKPLSTNSKVHKIGLGKSEDSKFYTVDGEVGKYLQQVEKKPVHSVVITIDGEQGAGKTTMLYKFMDAFATPGNSCLFISGEEHPSSSLATEKANKYLSAKAKEKIDTVGEVKDVAELYALIAPYDIVFIDSWQKLLRMIGNIRLDEDLRQNFHGKVFVIIFQQTTTGRTKGGAEVVFDGDIIIKMKKEASFAQNYAWFDKNRYTLVPIETIRYNIATGKTYNPEEPAQVEPSVQTELTKLSFTVTER